MEIHSSPPGRELTGEQIKRIKNLCALFSSYGLKSWDVRVTIDNFMRDMHPEAEISLWEGIAQVFNIEVADRGITKEGEDAHELYKFIIGMSMGCPQETDLDNIDRIKDRWKNLPHKKIKEAYAKDNC